MSKLSDHLDSMTFNLQIREDVILRFLDGWNPEVDIKKWTRPRKSRLGGARTEQMSDDEQILIAMIERRAR